MDVYATIWALVPPVVAIALALLTKEVYSSLLIGILAGGFLYSGMNFEKAMNHVFEDAQKAADQYVSEIRRIKEDTEKQAEEMSIWVTR